MQKSSTKHSPGPFAFKSVSSFGRTTEPKTFSVIDSEGRHLAEVLQTVGEDEARANAALFAAAPEMLEALISARGSLAAYISRINSHINRPDEKIDHELALESFGLVIAKAKGEA
jgi:hypothetical protein